MNEIGNIYKQKVYGLIHDINTIKTNNGFKGEFKIEVEDNLIEAIEFLRDRIVVVKLVFCDENVYNIVGTSCSEYIKEITFNGERIDGVILDKDKLYNIVWRDLYFELLKYMLFADNVSAKSIGNLLLNGYKK